MLDGLPREGKWVFPSPQRQGPVSATVFERFWCRIREEAEIGGDVRLHDCGHSNVSMTMRYAHVGDRDIEAAAERVGQAVAAMMAE